MESLGAHVKRILIVLRALVFTPEMEKFVRTNVI
jgi:hypothetical protein